ncbi:MAG TPA: hypothetical protein VGM26_16180 [Rhizomicrobium sp.]
MFHDAVALLVSEDGARGLFVDTLTKDFISDAFARCKIVGHSIAARCRFAGRLTEGAAHRDYFAVIA